jgi:hypothetical protein
MSVGGSKISQLNELAETIRDDALDFARTHADVSKSAWPLQRLFHDLEFYGNFKYSLGKSIADALVAHAPQICDIHFYEPFVNSEDQPADGLLIDASVHLLARISRSSAALELFIDALDQALVEFLKEIPLPHFSERTTVIDISLITDEDIRLGRGHASLLSTMYTPPLRIWTRAT